MKCIIKMMLALVLLVSMISPVLAGGGGQKSNASKNEESLVWLTLKGTPNDWDIATKPILDKYYQDTGVKVRGEFYAFNDLFQVIEVKIASGSKEYDVISVDVPMVAGYVWRGYLEPMDKFFTNEEKQQFIPSALAAGTWGGLFYAPPMNTSSQVLWYNKSLLDQADVKVRTSDTKNRLTYEEIVEYAKRALSKLDPNKTNGLAGLMFEQVSRTYQMCAVPNSMGEKSIGEDGLTVDGIINSPGWIKAMTWYQNLYKDGVSLRGFTADEVANLFISGKVLFMIGGTWNEAMLADKKDLQYGHAPVPAFKGHENRVASPTGSWHFGINKASTKKDLAGEFIKFMSLGEGNTMWLKAHNDVPSTKSAIDEVQNDPKANPIMKIAAYEAAHTAVPRALTPGYPEYSTILDAALEDIRNGSNIKNTLDNAVREMNSAFAKYK